MDCTRIEQGWVFFLKKLIADGKIGAPLAGPSIFSSVCSKAAANSGPRSSRGASCSRELRSSRHPEKIALADFHAIVTQDSVRDGGVEVEIRKRETIDELLAL